MRRSLRLAAALACCTVLGGMPARADTYERQPGISVEHYVFNVEVADNTHRIQGETVVTVRFTAPGVDHFFLDLAAPRADGTGMTVASVTQGGAATRFTHQGQRLTIQLGTAPGAGEVREYHIKYAGEPQDGMRFGTTDAGQRGIFTWNWPTKMREWAPTLDHVSSKVTTEFVITAPEQYTVAANGLLDSEVALGDGRKVTHWKQGVPITPWLNAVAIARFQTYYGGSARGVPLVIWAPTGQKVDVENGFTVARRTIDFFGDLVGPFPYEKLGQVVAPFDRSSTEHASVIFYGGGGVRDGEKPTPRRGNADAAALSRSGLLAHEIAHQWFGDSITEGGWGDVWLSEAFATYFADLYAEHYDGRDAFVTSLRSERTGALAAERRERDPVITPADDAAGPDLSRVQYVKGGWVLHMLRQQVTSPIFFKAIKTYYADHHGGHATTADLRRAMEAASGQDLGWFFDQWLTRVDSPKLDVSWVYDAAAKAVRVSVTQSQTGAAYRLPFEIGISDEPRGALRIQRFDIDAKQQEFTIPAEKAPAELLFDPDTKLLADVTLTRR
ncbi:M1 family metallopeptidase [Sphingomonas sp. dw_22]|uniref:M1 family metallopeptidase n=1 Tax=Sphingomonas sp. dw_22 TaxID=2721175 RepID=UPI001BD587CD